MTTTTEKIFKEVKSLTKRDKLVVASVASALLQSQKEAEETEKSKDQHKKGKKAA